MFFRLFFSFECPFSTPLQCNISSKYPTYFFVARYQHMINDDLSKKKSPHFREKYIVLSYLKSLLSCCWPTAGHECCCGATLPVLIEWPNTTVKLRRQSRVHMDHGAQTCHLIYLLRVRLSKRNQTRRPQDGPYPIRRVDRGHQR